jgi:Holliday junction resolvasome RuvABC endonuclease subunit
MNGRRIIAVDPGRGTLGIAIFEGASLRYYAVKTLRVQGTPVCVRRAAARVLTDLIAKYRPSHMAIEQPVVVQQRAALLAHVIGALKTTARHHGLIVSEHSPLMVRRFICKGAKPTKRAVAQRLATRYPELGRYISPQSRWAELYYERMFGAVAVGLVAYALFEQANGKISAA